MNIFASTLFYNTISLILYNNYLYRKEIIFRYKKFVVIIRNLNTMKFASKKEYYEYCQFQKNRFILEFIIFLIRHCVIIFFNYIIKEKNNLSNSAKNIKQVSIIKSECINKKEDFIFDFNFNIEKKVA